MQAGEARDGTCDLVEWQGLFGVAERDGFARHPEDDAGFFVLGDGMGARGEHFAKAGGPIGAHAREDDAERVRACMDGGGAEEDIDRGR